MAARLGNVLYWIGCGIAVLSLIFAATLLVGAHRDDKLIAGLPLIAGVLAWLAGRAARYVLGGR